MTDLQAVDHPAIRDCLALIQKIENLPDNQKKEFLLISANQLLNDLFFMLIEL